MTSLTGTLLYIQGGPLIRRPDGRLGVHAKTASGLEAFASRWDGRVEVSALSAPAPVCEDQVPDGYVWMSAGAESSFDVNPVVKPDHVARHRTAVVHASVNTPGIADVVRGPVPTVLGDDNSPRVRTDITLVGASGTVDRMRIKAGAVRKQRRFDRLARVAAGFHANGYASYSHYERFNGRTLRYFDHRITRAMVNDALPRESHVRTEIHLAFSGRLVEIKGVNYLPILADELARRGLRVELSVLGSGPMREEIAVSPYIHFHGHLDFETDWRDFMRSVDVMFLPHIQGDSSSTYYEAMGMGVPVLGFRNATLAPLLADGGGGWEVPRGDIRSAADVIEMICCDGARLRAQSVRAIEYMRRIPMERIFDDRVEDFRRVADGS